MILETDQKAFIISKESFVNYQGLSLLIKDDISEGEKAFVNNLIGVINFSKQEYDLALKYFESSLELDPDDPILEAQLYLNK